MGVFWVKGRAGSQGWQDLWDWYIRRAEATGPQISVASCAHRQDRATRDGAVRFFRCRKCLNLSFPIRSLAARPALAPVLTTQRPGCPHPFSLFGPVRGVKGCPGTFCKACHGTGHDFCERVARYHGPESLPVLKKPTSDRQPKPFLLPLSAKTKTNKHP